MPTLAESSTGKVATMKHGIYKISANVFEVYSNGKLIGSASSPMQASLMQLDYEHSLGEVGDE
jgi:hypothetical protein